MVLSKKVKELLLTEIDAVDIKSSRVSCLKAYKSTVVTCKNYLKGFEPSITDFRGMICHKDNEKHRSRRVSKILYEIILVETCKVYKIGL